MTRAEFADVIFKVSEWDDGTPFLTPLENGPQSNSILNDKNVFAIHLQDETTRFEAEALANHINRYATKLSITFQT